MLFNILILVALLTLIVSHLYLVFRKQKKIDSDRPWLSLRVAIKDLEIQLGSIEEEIAARAKGLDARLGIHSSVVGDMGQQMIAQEECLLKKLEEMSETTSRRSEQFEKQLMKQLSATYRKHNDAIKKLSEETWSALTNTNEQLETLSTARVQLERSLTGFQLEYRKRLKEVQVLIDANHELFDEANHDLHSSIDGLSQDLSETRNSFDKDIQENRVQAEELSQSIASLAKSMDSKLNSQATKAKHLVEETRRLFERSLAEDHSKLANQTSQEINDLDSRFTGEIEDLDTRLAQATQDWDAQLTRVAQEIDNDLTRLTQKDSHFESNQKNLGERIVSIQNELKQVKEHEQVFTKHVQRQNQITKNIENLVNGSNAFNYNTFKAFNRRFVRKDYDESLRPIIDYFGLSISFNTIGYLAHKICKIEESCVGRLATNIQDALIRLICVLALKRSSAKILEIGTLFGINLCIVEELCSAYGKNLSYQVIDPLDGYYKSGQLDIVTKQKIDNRNFWFNIRKCGLESEKFELIEGFSHYKKVVNRVRDKSIDLAFIDGDHTKKGVALDIRNYHKKLRKGGYFLFDDYGSVQWPEVKEAVDGSRIIKNQFDFVGRAFRTAIFSKK